MLHSQEYAEIGGYDIIILMLMFYHSMGSAQGIIISLILGSYYNTLIPTPLNSNVTSLKIYLDSFEHYSFLMNIIHSHISESSERG
jgi:hypothetical protein